MDFELKLPYQHLSNKNHSRSNSKMHQQHEMSFTSYGESLRELTLHLSVNDRDRYSKFFDFFNQQKSQKANHNESLISQDRIKVQSNNHQNVKPKLRRQKISESFIFEIKDQSDKIKVQNNNILLQEINEQDDQFQVKQFTHEERQSLKNAFRYICRLVFKQAHKYSDKMSQLFSNKNNHLPHVHNSHLHQQKPHTKKSRRKKSSLSIVQYATLSQLNLLQQAQLISGERYFKQYLQKLQTSQRKILLNYMIWFLRTKYLRYINKCNNENKGKRKQMKKDLYIRFKNITMLPYLQALLEENTSSNER